MADGIGMAAVRLCTSLLSSMQTASEIDKHLNDQIAGESWTFSNYRDEQTTISIESITVRPKFSPRAEDGGIQKAEGDNLFTEYEKERSDPTILERLNAIIRNQWITVVRLEIDGDDAARVRPSGLNLNYVTSHEVLRFNSQSDADTTELFSVPAIRVPQSRDVGSDKLEMKLRYDGSLGKYRRRISSSIDILKDIQEETEFYVMRYLMELHHSGSWDDSNSEFVWPAPDRVRKLGYFLLEGPVDMQALAEHLEETKQELKEQSLDPKSVTE